MGRLAPAAQVVSPSSPLPGDHQSDQDAEHLANAECLANMDEADRKARARSIGEVASPLLAGFSFTNVIVIAMSSDTENFLLPGVAMISWAVASIAFIASVGFAKYVAEVGLKDSTVASYEWRTDFCYHVGVVTFLLGFGLALAPQHSSGSWWFRWVASGIAFAACAIWAFVYMKRAGLAWIKRIQASLSRLLSA